jgi:hypothetical protein
MKRTLIVLAVVAALPVIAAEPDGTVVWKAAELKEYGKKLAAKVDEKKLAFERLGTFGNHSAMTVHREGDGEAEWHEVQADFLVVQGGTATLVLGGTVKDGKTTAKGEVRGPSIDGGQKHPLAAGDVVHIPAKTAHQLLIPAGTAFDYFVVKVDTP